MVAHGLSLISCLIAAGSASEKLGFWRTSALHGLRLRQRLPAGRPVEVAATHLLHDHLAAAPRAALAGALVDVVPLLAAGHRPAVRLLGVEVVAGHHLAGPHPDLEQVRPVAPQLPQE